MHPSLLRTAVALAVLPALAALVGCRAGPASAPADARPPDFALGLTVFPTGSATGIGADTATGHSSRGERYLLEPDGVLRAAFGGGVSPRMHPPRVRRLSLAEYDELHRIALDSGLLGLASSPDPGGPEPSPDAFRPPVGASVALVQVAANGDARSIAIDLGEPGPRAAALRPVLDWWRERTWRAGSLDQSRSGSGD